MTGPEKRRNQNSYRKNGGSKETSLSKPIMPSLSGDRMKDIIFLGPMIQQKYQKAEQGTPLQLLGRQKKQKEVQSAAEYQHHGKWITGGSTHSGTAMSQGIILENQMVGGL